jgi:hypothetical protein
MKIEMSFSFINYYNFVNNFTKLNKKNTSIPSECINFWDNLIDKIIQKTC